MNSKTKIRISIMLCFALLFYSFQPAIFVGAASGDPVPTNVSFWGFDSVSAENTLNQGNNTIMCLYDFETESYILVRCPDHMYYISSGKVVTSEDYSSMTGSSFKDVLKENVVASWGQGRGYFNLNASQLFTCWGLGPSGNVVNFTRSSFDGVFNLTSYSTIPRKYDVLRYLYINDQDSYNKCRYGLCWSTQELDWSFSGFGNFVTDMQNAISFTASGGIAWITFKGGVTYALSDTDIPRYIFYPGGFSYSVDDPGGEEDEPTPSPTPFYFPKFINAYKDNYLNNQNRAVTKYLVCSRYYDETNLRYEYKCFVVFQRFYPSLYGNNPIYTPSYNGYDFVDNTLTFYFPNIAPNENWNGRYSYKSFVSDDLFTENDSYDLSNIVSMYPSLEMQESTERNYEFSYSDSSMNYEDTAIYTINTDGSTTLVTGGEEVPTPSPTATPTPFIPVYNSPTPTPTLEPGVTVVPTQGPSETSVKELRGWKKGLQTVLQTVFVGNTDAIAGYFKDAVSGYEIVQNPFKQITDSIYINGSDQENFDPFENQQVEFVFDVHDKDGNILGGEHTANWRLTILPKTFWEWLKQYSNYFEIVFYSVDACFLGATMKRWLTKQNDEGSETKEGGSG